MDVSESESQGPVELTKRRGVAVDVEALDRYRSERDLNKTQLANIAGISERTLIRIVDDRWASKGSVKKLASALDVKPEALLTEEAVDSVTAEKELQKDRLEPGYEFVTLYRMEDASKLYALVYQRAITVEVGFILSEDDVDRLTSLTEELERLSDINDWMDEGAGESFSQKIRTIGGLQGRLRELEDAEIGVYAGAFDSRRKRPVDRLSRARAEKAGIAPVMAAYTSRRTAIHFMKTASRSVRVKQFAGISETEFLKAKAEYCEFTDALRKARTEQPDDDDTIPF